MKYGWFVPPVYQLSMPPSAICRSASLAGKLSGVKKSSGASVRKSLQPARTSVATSGMTLLTLMALLLEVEVHAERERPGPRIVGVVPAELGIVRVARTGLGVVPGVARGGEEILPAEVEAELSHAETRAERPRHHPCEGHVLQPDERAVLHPARRQIRVRSDVQGRQRVGGGRGSPVVQSGREHVGRAARHRHPAGVQVDHLEVQGAAQDPTEGERFVGHGAGQTEQVTRLRVAEDGSVVRSDLAIWLASQQTRRRVATVDVLQLLAAADGAGLVAGINLRLDLEEAVPEVAVEVPQRLPDLHDRPVPDGRERAVRAGQGE